MSYSSPTGSSSRSDKKTFSPPSSSGSAGNHKTTAAAIPSLKLASSSQSSSSSSFPSTNSFHREAAFHNGLVPHPLMPNLGDAWQDSKEHWRRISDANTTTVRELLSRTLKLSSKNPATSFNISIQQRDLLQYILEKLVEKNYLPPQTLHRYRENSYFLFLYGHVPLQIALKEAKSSSCEESTQRSSHPILPSSIISILIPIICPDHRTNSQFDEVIRLIQEYLVERFPIPTTDAKLYFGSRQVSGNLVSSDRFLIISMGEGHERLHLTFAVTIQSTITHLAEDGFIPIPLQQITSKNPLTCLHLVSRNADIATLLQANFEGKLTMHSPETLFNGLAHYIDAQVVHLFHPEESVQPSYEQKLITAFLKQTAEQTTLKDLRTFLHSHYSHSPYAKFLHVTVLIEMLLHALGNAEKPSQELQETTKQAILLWHETSISFANLAVPENAWLWIEVIYYLFSIETSLKILSCECAFSLPQKQGRHRNITTFRSLGLEEILPINLQNLIEMLIELLETAPSYPTFQASAMIHLFFSVNEMDIQKLVELAVSKEGNVDAILDQLKVLIEKQEQPLDKVFELALLISSSLKDASIAVSISIELLDQLLKKGEGSEEIIQKIISYLTSLDLQKMSFNPAQLEKLSITFFSSLDGIIQENKFHVWQPLLEIFQSLPISENNTFTWFLKKDFTEEEYLILQKIIDDNALDKELGTNTSFNPYKAFVEYFVITDQTLSTNSSYQKETDLRMTRALSNSSQATETLLEELTDKLDRYTEKLTDTSFLAIVERIYSVISESALIEKEAAKQFLIEKIQSRWKKFQSSFQGTPEEQIRNPLTKQFFHLFSLFSTSNSSYLEEIQQEIIQALFTCRKQVPKEALIPLISFITENYFTPSELEAKVSQTLIEESCSLQEIDLEFIHNIEKATSFSSLPTVIGCIQATSHDPNKVIISIQKIIKDYSTWLENPEICLFILHHILDNFDLFYSRHPDDLLVALQKIHEKQTTALSLFLPSGFTLDNVISLKNSMHVWEKQIIDLAIPIDQAHDLLATYIYLTKIDPHFSSILSCNSTSLLQFTDNFSVLKEQVELLSQKIAPTAFLSILLDMIRLLSPPPKPNEEVFFFLVGQFSCYFFDFLSNRPLTEFLDTLSTYQQIQVQFNELFPHRNKRSPPSKKNKSPPSPSIAATALEIFQKEKKTFSSSKNKAFFRAIVLEKFSQKSAPTFPIIEELVSKNNEEADSIALHLIERDLENFDLNNPKIIFALLKASLKAAQKQPQNYLLLLQKILTKIDKKNLKSLDTSILLSLLIQFHQNNIALEEEALQSIFSSENLCTHPFPEIPLELLIFLTNAEFGAETKEKIFIFLRQYMSKMHSSFTPPVLVEIYTKVINYYLSKESWKEALEAIHECSKLETVMLKLPLEVFSQWIGTIPIENFKDTQVKKSFSSIPLPHLELFIAKLIQEHAYESLYHLIENQEKAQEMYASHILTLFLPEVVSFEQASYLLLSIFYLVEKKLIPIDGTCLTQLEEIGKKMALAQEEKPQEYQFFTTSLFSFILSMISPNKTEMDKDSILRLVTWSIHLIQQKKLTLTPATSDLLYQVLANFFEDIAVFHEFMKNSFHFSRELRHFILTILSNLFSSTKVSLEQKIKMYTTLDKQNGIIPTLKKLYLRHIITKIGSSHRDITKLIQWVLPNINMIFDLEDHELTSLLIQLFYKDLKKEKLHIKFLDFYDLLVAHFPFLPSTDASITNRNQQSMQNVFSILYIAALFQKTIDNKDPINHFETMINLMVEKLLEHIDIIDNPEISPYDLQASLEAVAATATLVLNATETNHRLIELLPMVIRLMQIAISHNIPLESSCIDGYLEKVYHKLYDWAVSNTEVIRNRGLIDALYTNWLDLTALQERGINTSKSLSFLSKTLTYLFSHPNLASSYHKPLLEVISVTSEKRLPELKEMLNTLYQHTAHWLIQTQQTLKFKTDIVFYTLSREEHLQYTEFLPKISRDFFNKFNEKDSIEATRILFNVFWDMITFMHQEKNEVEIVHCNQSFTLPFQATCFCHVALITVLNESQDAFEKLMQTNSIKIKLEQLLMELFCSQENFLLQKDEADQSKQEAYEHILLFANRFIRQIPSSDGQKLLQKLFTQANQTHILGDREAQAHFIEAILTAHPALKTDFTRSSLEQLKARAHLESIKLKEMDAALRDLALEFDSSPESEGSASQEPTEAMLRNAFSQGLEFFKSIFKR